MPKALALIVALLFATAQAFTWQLDQIPPGDHYYLLELISTEADGTTQRATVAIDVKAVGSTYDVQTTYSISQTGVAAGDLSAVWFGGSMLAMAAFGPMLMYGPMFFLMPMMLGNEEIRVRSEPIIVMGMGRLYMERTERVAGHECVVIRFEASDGGMQPMEFALAENVPFPCFSRYHNDDGSSMEIRLIEAR